MPTRSMAAWRSSFWPRCCCGSGRKGSPVTDRDASLPAEIVVPNRAPARHGLVLATLAGLGLVLVAPLMLDTYTVNVLTRSLLYAAVALTLDVLWGYTGILSYGQSAFFAIGAYALGLASTHIGFDVGIAAAAFLSSLVLAGVA